MDCQSDACLKAVISLIPLKPIWIGRALPRAVPPCGHGGTDPRYDNSDSTKDAVIPVWPSECNLQKVHARPRRLQINSAMGTLPFPLHCPKSQFALGSGS